MNNENYTYPALFEYDEDNQIIVTFPDFPGAVTEGSDMKEAVANAQEVLAMTIVDYNDRGEALPDPGYETESHENSIVLINIWLPFYRSKIKEVYVKKTLTIPSWLNVLAQQNNLNFSAILVEGLKSHLNLS